MLIWNTYIYEVKSIGMSTRNGRKPQTLLVAARHNLREIQAENGADHGKIDSSRTHLNEVLLGPATAKGVVDTADQIFVDAGVDPAKLRRDFNQASEHVFSLRSGQEEGYFFKVIAERAKLIFGPEKVLSFVIHRDQAQPHAHMLVSPVSNGRYMGSKLHSHEPLKKLKEAFKSAAEEIGFRPANEMRLRRKNLCVEAADVIAYLEYANDPLMFHPMWPLISRVIVSDPRPFYDHLKLSACNIPKAISQQRLVSRGRSTSREKCAKSNVKNVGNLPSVGFDNAEPLSQENEIVKAS